MKSKFQWLCLEPYVHFVRRNAKALFYNTLNRKVLEFFLNHTLENLIEQLEDPANGYVVPLSESLLEDPAVGSFIRKLRQAYMADLLDPAWSETKPVNIIPEPYIKNPLHLKQQERHELTAPIDPRQYLREVTFYLRSAPDAAVPGFPDASYQCGYPELLSEEEVILPITRFETLLHELTNYTPSLIHLTGADIFQHPNIDTIIHQLNQNPFEKKYHLHLARWDQERMDHLLAGTHNIVALYLTFPVNPDELGGWIQSITGQYPAKRLEFNLMIRNEEEWQNALEIAPAVGGASLFFKPYFTGSNLKFFEDNVFISHQDILDGKPTQPQIMSRLTINENDFGKFTIVPSGEGYANPNDPPLDPDGNKTLHQMIESEIVKGQSWKRTRKLVSPCNECLCQFLCPPISSYENFMNRYNFCDILPNTTAQ